VFDECPSVQEGREVFLLDHMYFMSSKTWALNLSLKRATASRASPCRS